MDISQPTLDGNRQEAKRYPSSLMTELECYVSRVSFLLILFTSFMLCTVIWCARA